MSLIPGLTAMTVRTRFLPPIVLDFEAPEGGAPTDAISKFLQPTASATIFGREMVLYSPYGPAGENYWVAATTGVLGLAALVGILVYRGLTK